MLVRRHLPAVPSPSAVTIGNFDGVHIGHRAMLARTVDTARRLGVAAWALVFEPHPREFFAPDRAPARLTPLRDKLELLAAHGLDGVQICGFGFEFASTSPEDFVSRVLRQGLAARWLLVGEDFRFGARRAGDAALLRAAQADNGYELEIMPPVMLDGLRVSSTRVRDALAAGDMAGAARLLGRPYGMSGRVVHGERIGRRLGWPTVNLLPRHNRPPLGGIFAVEVRGAGPDTVRGVASLGVRPTVSREPLPVLEVHLLDFEGDLYGRRLCVDFLHKFRDEAKFADLETLRGQIARDVEDARRWFAAADRHSVRA